MCAQVIVPIAYPPESSAENHPALVSDGSVGTRGGVRLCLPQQVVCPVPGTVLWESLVECTCDLSCVSYGVVSNSASAYQNWEYKIPPKIVWVLILRWDPASGKTK